MKITSFFSSLICTTVLVHGLNGKDMKQFESLRGIPAGWQFIGSPEPDTRMAFKIALKLADQALFDQTLYDLANPAHPRYGKHLGRKQLKALVRPTPIAVKQVSEWLRQSGVKSTDINIDSEWVNFVATIEQANAMLNTEFHLYQNQNRRNVTKIRTLEYSLPRELFEHVDLVQPTTRFAQIKPEGNAIHDKQNLGSAKSVPPPAAIAVDCNITITPTCLRDMYKIKGFTPDPKKGGFIGISGFLEEYAQYGDLAQWIPDYAPWATGANFTWTSVNGAPLLQGAADPYDSGEANLDIQYTIGLTYPMRNNFYSAPGHGPLVPDLDQPTQADNTNEPYLEYLTYLLSLPNKDLPHTITTSYGEDEQSLPKSYTLKVCDMFGLLTAKGVSFIFSSGDTGVGSACQTNDGKNTTRFLPMFPATCPYVTSVGATRYINPESALYFSSGGFSDLFPRPVWQETAVSGYLAHLGSKWRGLYNPQGRGFPDVAAQGRRFRVIDKGQMVEYAGTSCSAPTVASIIALVNAALIQAGRPPLGWLNPRLYGDLKGAFTDIVDGGSTGCTGIDQYSGLTTPIVPFASWNATAGWDPVTGLGTPLFNKLLAMAAPGVSYH
ncbi:hypothetical protein EG327_006665 [Venturia inaequalis]|uniref:tripeptidyl-peptidase II n=1 Tax=Venturia inaequalis TaxID=5025 RepID=A0A8H3V0M4_VENIN|nr:hypothetical protein EG327_006665 [Venturia inaequalis]